MTSATRPNPTNRPTAARLARLHLRGGALSLARAELETLAGRDALDEDALLDLAEVRWRTGDLAGAGDAARAFLETGLEDPVALVIAAEAADALGRPAEARRLAAQALAEHGSELDAVFAGMPRSAAWPGRPEEAVQRPLFAAPDLAEDLAGGGAGSFAAPSIDVSAVAASAWSGTLPPGLWDATGAPGGTAGATATANGQLLPPARVALDAGRMALATGHLEAALVQLGIALRLEPALAAVILELLGPVEGPGVELLRGDAHRFAGSEDRARLAWAAAFRGAGERGTGPTRQDEHGTDASPHAGEVAGATDVTSDNDPQIP